jgi:hypothetical protein
MSDQVQVQDKRDRSVGDLVEQMSQDTRELVRAEVAFARAELVDSARRLSLAGALVAAAAVFALAAFGAVVAAAILGLATAISAWLAALVVGLALVAAAAVAVAVGLRVGRRSLPPVPTETIDSIKEDVAWVKTRARSGMR